MKRVLREMLGRAVEHVKATKRSGGGVSFSWAPDDSEKREYREFDAHEARTFMAKVQRIVQSAGGREDLRIDVGSRQRRSWLNVSLSCDSGTAQGIMEDLDDAGFMLMNGGFFPGEGDEKPQFEVVVSGLRDLELD